MGIVAGIFILKGIAILCLIRTAASDWGLHNIIKGEEFFKTGFKCFFFFRVLGQQHRQGVFKQRTIFVADKLNGGHDIEGLSRRNLNFGRPQNLHKIDDCFLH